MSIIRSLLRLVDPIEHRRRITEEQRKREVLPPDIDPESIDWEPPPRRVQAAPPRTCRVCGHRGDTTYCPSCLAETMEPDR